MKNRIELFKEDMKFSIAHFTIFSQSERENLHGHNYSLKVILDLKKIDNGMAFNYQHIKKIARDICDSLDEKFVIQKNSQFLKVKVENEYVFIDFNKTKMMLPKRDILVLPIENTTLECFGDYILEKIYKRIDRVILEKISKVGISISSSPGQIFFKELLVPLTILD